jgi:DNA-binding transcriptional LysR family regulator
MLHRKSDGMHEMNLAQIDLNLLVSLDALLAERHVTRASERVGLSQPAMSSALARLRIMFGDELLVRVGREYQLTELALELREPLRQLLQLAEETVQRRPSFNPATDKRVFTVVASDYSAYLALHPLLRRVTERAPGVSIQIRRSATPELERSEADLKLGLWPSPDPNDEELHHEILFRDRWVCAVWAGNENVGDQIDLDSYLEMPHLVYGNGLSEVRGMADRTVRDMGLPRHVQGTVDSFFLLPFLIRGSNLVAFIQERLGRKLAQTEDIRIVEPRFETPPVAEAMFWYTRNNSDPAHRWLRQQLLEISAEL